MEETKKCEKKNSNFTEPEGSESNNLVDLSNFIYKRVLCDNLESKSVFIEGTFQDKTGAVVLILEKEPFQEKSLQTLFKEENVQEKVFQNDIYSSFRYFPKFTFNGIKVTGIYPATEKHIKKYEFQPSHIVNETPELYGSVVLPYIKEEQFSLQWVYNILEHKSERDRIFYEDADPEHGFILLPDLKWDGKTIESLYLLALPHKRGIFSLRDLNEQHLPLLRNIYTKGINAIKDKCSLQESQIRTYIHYQPTFYHLHIHFTYLQYSPPGINTERSHMLPTVISNIELMTDYYQKATIPFSVKESDNLFAKFEQFGLLKRVKKDT